MKAVQTKTATAASPASATLAKAEAPFFSKGGAEDFFHSKTTDPFFSNNTAAIPVQAKLSVGKPGDRYEREADAMADKVVQRMSEPENTLQRSEEPLAGNITPVVQLKCKECEQEEKLQKQEEDRQIKAPENLPMPTEKQEEGEPLQRKAIFESEEEMPLQAKACEDKAPAEKLAEVEPVDALPVQAKCAECEKEEQEENLQKQDEEQKEAAPAQEQKPMEPQEEDEQMQRKAIFESNEEAPVQTKAAHDNAACATNIESTAKPIIQSKCKECEEEEKAQEEDAGKEQEEQLQRKAIFESNEEKHVQQKADPSKENLAPVKVQAPEPTPPAPKKVQPVAATAPVTIQAEQNTEMEEEKQEDKDNGEVVQKKPVFDGGKNNAPSMEHRLSTSKGGGQSLPEETRSKMEGSFGADFSQVKVHTNSTAVQLSKDLNAHAFTHGNDIYFNEGKYDPSSKDGSRLLAHELTHTIQQGASASVQRSSQVPDIQKIDDAPENVRRDVNREANRSYNNVVTNFNNGISLFQNWYFTKDEGERPLFGEISDVIKDAAGQVTNTSTVIGAKIAPVFWKGASAVVQERRGFITSLTAVIRDFSAEVRSTLTDKTAEIVETTDSAGWASISQTHSANGNWIEMLTQKGLPAPSLTNLQQHLLSELIFRYNRWELRQHSLAYQGIHSMADPHLHQMRAGAEAEAQRLIAHPRINLGDVIFSLPDQELIGRQSTKPFKNEYTIGQAGLSVPIFTGLGVGVNGSLKAGYDMGASFGPIKFTHLQFGFSYTQAPIMFSLLGGLLLINGLTGLQSISRLYGTRFRATGQLEVPAEASAKLYVAAALGIGLEIGIPNIISANVAGIEGSFRAEFGAGLQAGVNVPLDIIIDRGNMSFSHAVSARLGANVGFKVTGGIKAHFLTLDWEKRWDILNLAWSRKWEFDRNMNLIYMNGLQGDPEKTFSLENFIHSVSELVELGNQIMNATSDTPAPGGGGTAPPAPGSGGAPNPSGHLNLRWPKPPSANYPAIYLTTRGETRSQRVLRDLFESGQTRNIEKFTIHEKKFMPANEAELGINEEFQIFEGKDVGPLSLTGTPGGKKINDLVREYGIDPTQQNGDHVYEIQLGGIDSLVNLWPLDASVNSSGGSRLARAQVTEASTGHVFTIDFLKRVIAHYPGTNYFFIIRGFEA
ncbi:MAG TPA: DUF4157 domain-containing protein [Chitinophagaceae bacterium]|nr:DUF4157 domain-containing protein [Chitinophagaceae bacterium]